MIAFVYNGAHLKSSISLLLVNQVHSLGCMFNNFGGSARSRPRVNLGGKKKELTKEELLRKAAAERQQREELRQRDAATRRIQRQWTRWKARRVVMDAMRRQYDLTWEGGTLVEALQEYPTRLFFFFFNPRTDRSRTFRIVKVLLESPPEAQTELLARRGRLLDCLVDTYRANRLEETQVTDLLILANKLAQLPRPHDSAVLTRTYNSQGLYEVLSQDLTRCSVQQPQPHHEQALVACIISPLTGKATSEQAVENYASFSLTVLANSSFCQFSTLLRLSLELSIPALVSGMRAPLPSSINPEHRLANLISITVDRMTPQPDHVKDDWMSLIVLLLKASYDFLAVSHSNSPDPDADQEEESSSSSGPLTLLPFLFKHLQDSTIQQIRRLYTSAIIRTLLGGKFSRSFCIYVGSLLQYYPQSRDQIMMTLSLFATTPSSSYNLLEASYTAWLRDVETVAERSKQIPGTMLFYLELLYRVLLTMVDDEFFDAKRNPVALCMIQASASRLKDTAYDAYMKYDSLDYIVSDYTIRGGYVQELVSRVLQQIQIRDSRRPFLPKDFWLYTERFETRNLVAQVTSEAFPDEEDEDEDDVPRSRGLKGSISPRIKILSSCPFFFPFATRLEILQALIERDAEKNGFRDYFSRATKHHVVCRRDHEFEDGFESLWKIGGGIKGPLSVDYRDVYGLQEAGIDGGGLTKEFLTSICKQAFHPEFGMFLETPERLLYPNPNLSARTSVQLQQYEFLGRVIAKCIYEGILVDVAFAPFFLLNWIGKLAYIDDLQAMDRDLYNGLIQLKNYPGDVENDLALDFTINEEEGVGKQRTINLVPNGADVPVTRLNRLQYIHLVCHFKLNTRLARQSQAFVKGMSDVLDLRWLGMFNQNEMQALVGGAPVPIDLNDLKRNTVYGGYDETDPTVQIFWDVLSEFNNEERRKLIKFVTSTPRPPLLGFKELQPKFSLRHAGTDINRLPTASTCVNLLKLPAYQSHEQMRKKLRLSITAEAGFDLS